MLFRSVKFPRASWTSLSRKFSLRTRSRMPPHQRKRRDPRQVRPNDDRRRYRLDQRCFPHVAVPILTCRRKRKKNRVRKYPEVKANILQTRERRRRICILCDPGISIPCVLIWRTQNASCVDCVKQLIIEADCPMGSALYGQDTDQFSLFPIASTSRDHRNRHSLNRHCAGCI